MWGGIKQPIDKPPSPFYFHYSKMKITRNMILGGVALILLTFLIWPDAGNNFGVDIMKPAKVVTFNVKVSNPILQPMQIDSYTQEVGGSCTITGFAALPILEDVGTVTASVGKYSKSSEQITLFEGASLTKEIRMCIPEGSYSMSLKLKDDANNVLSTKTGTVTV
jgi:hypothetical protein